MRVSARAIGKVRPAVVAAGRKEKKGRNGVCARVRKVPGAKYLGRGTEVPAMGYPRPLVAAFDRVTRAFGTGSDGVFSTKPVPERRYTC